MVDSSNILTIRRPDDWHVHLRDGSMLAEVLRYTAAQFARAVVMPNLTPPVTSIEAARAYTARIRAALPAGSDFQPLMTCYLTDSTDADQLAAGFEQGVWVAAKLYPAHATTNSAHGVTDPLKLVPVLERMAEIGMPLLVHGEVTDPNVDIFDREAVFIDRILMPLIRAVPELKVVLEHITTAEAVDFVLSQPRHLAATVTAHHLIINRTSMFQGGIRPHLYCLPIAKRETHRLALVKAATSGDARFFLGTDSAPHLAHAKEAPCGCAGIFSAPAALETYLAVFEAEGALDRFEGFASLHGPAFYGLPVNDGTITLARRARPVPDRVSLGKDHVVVFQGGDVAAWRIV